MQRVTMQRVTKWSGVSLIRDDNGLVRAKPQPTAVPSDHQVAPPCFLPVIYRKRCNFSVSRRKRGRASDHLLGLVVGLAVTPQGRRLGAGIKLCQPGGDLGVLALEQAVAGKVAFDQERSELIDVEHPDRLRQSQFLKPIDAGDA